MTVVLKNQPVLLLGGGYTLSKVADKLASEKISTAITTRSLEKAETFKDAGLQTLCFDFESTPVNELMRFLKSAQIPTIVDSIPPPVKSGAIHQKYAEYIASLKQTSVDSVIYLSTTGVFGCTDGSVVDESTPASPKTDRARARYEIETLYKKQVPHSCILRIPAIYSEERGLLKSLKEGTYPLVGDGTRWSNRIHVDDLAGVIVSLLSLHKSMWPGLVCVADDEPAQQKEIVSYFQNQYGTPAPRTIPPEEVAKVSSTLMGNQRVSNALLKSTVYPSLIYPSFRSATWRL